MSCFSPPFPNIYSCYKALRAAGFSDCGYVSGYNISQVFLFSFRPLRSESVGQEGYYYRGYNYAIFAGWLSSLSFP